MAIFFRLPKSPEYDQGDNIHPVEDAFAPPPTAPPPLAPSATSDGLVAIFILRADGRPDIEGRAWIIAPTGRNPFEYSVIFENENPRRLRRRLVLPFQSDPETALQAMLALYEQFRSPTYPDEFLSDLLATFANDNTPAAEKEA